MLSVLSVAYPLAPVGLDPVGGAEQVLANIDRALVAAGHRSCVLAGEGSSSSGQLVAVDIGSDALSASVRERVTLAYREKLKQLLSEQRFDVLHFHGVDCDAYLPDLSQVQGIPQLITLHLPFESYPKRLFHGDRRVSFSCVSAWQGRHVEQHVPVRASIENGVDVQRWRPLPEQLTGDYVACLGRICPEKGFDVALRAAHSARVGLLLAGQVFGYPEHKAYFSDCILPLLDVQRRFIGPVAGTAKREFLARARCLVVSSRVAETSSLVTMEALACGTPVIVTDAGAPCSLIEPGVTGLVAADEAALSLALQRVHQLDRRACRASAEQRFDLRRSTGRYLELYAELAGAGRAVERRRFAAGSSA